MTQTGAAADEGEHGLTDIALPDLRHLAGRLASGELSAPFDTFALASVGLPARCCGPLAAVLRGMDQCAARSLIAVAIAERLYRPPPRLDLVWTGPEAKGSSARDTRVVVRQPFESATRSVIVGGFTFDHGRELFEPRHARMLQGVEVDIFIGIDQPEPGETVTGPELATREIQRFLRFNWPFGRPQPRIYYDPRTTVCGPPHVSLHAKCVVVDDSVALVTSANFTNRGQTRNIEVGVLIEDPEFAQRLAAHWRGLVARVLVHGFHVPPEQS
jgi:hypothetical protein